MQRVTIRGTGWSHWIWPNIQQMIEISLENKCTMSQKQPQNSSLVKSKVTWKLSRHIALKKATLILYAQNHTHHNTHKLKSNMLQVSIFHQYVYHGGQVTLLRNSSVNKKGKNLSLLKCHEMFLKNRNFSCIDVNSFWKWLETRICCPCSLTW